MKYRITKANIGALSAKKKSDPVFIIGITICTLVLLGVAIYFISLAFNYSNADNLYDNLQNQLDVIERLPYMALPDADPYLTDYETLLAGGSALSGGSKSESIEFIKMKTTLSTLRRVNEDIMGWIHIDDTGINYPTVRGKDNDFYLNHAYDKEFMNAGSIFLDYRCTDSLENTRNTVIYGHNMFSGLMFHDVIEYKDEEFFSTHNITITTYDGIHTFRPIAIYETISTDRYFRVDFEDDADFESFLTTAIEKSMFKTDYVPSGSDRIITFSTCTNDSESGRLVLHAVLTDKRT